MAECECVGGCPFFNGKMKDNEGLGSMFKKRYCLGDNSRCARYMVFSKLGKSVVPSDLYPNMIDRANDMLAGKA